MFERALAGLQRLAQRPAGPRHQSARCIAEHARCPHAAQPQWRDDTSLKGGPCHLSARGVSYQVGRHQLLDRVDLNVTPGEVLVVVGPNGAGKSTLLKVLAGDLAPAEGRVFLDGHALVSYRPDQLALRRAVLPQQIVLQFAFTVQEVVAMGRYPHHRQRADDPHAHRLAVQHALEATDTLDLAERIFPTLSGGEQERVSLARVLAQQTPILLLDEPTSSLDIRHQELVMRIARNLAARGTAVLAILHDLNLAASYADRIALLHHGRLVACGPPTEVLTGPLLSDVFEHPIAVAAHPARDCPLVVPLPPGEHRDARVAQTFHRQGPPN